jgi:hypothetical protein
MKFSENPAKLFEAFAKVREAIEQPAKAGQANYGTFVTLDDMERAITNAEKGSGVAHLQEVTSDERLVKVTTYIVHSSGAYMQFDPFAVPAAKTDAQAFGSAETYARRYSLAAAYGIVSEEDDDGNSATAGIGNRNANQRTSQHKAPSSRPNQRPQNQQYAQSAYQGPSPRVRVVQAIKAAATRTGDKAQTITNLVFAKTGKTYSPAILDQLTQDDATAIVAEANKLQAVAQ